MTTMRDKVYILLLNWNGWADTIECLESVFRNNYPNYQVIVCDNDSSDNSLDHLKNWAKGNLPVSITTDNPLYALSSPPVAKPIPYVEYTRKQAEAGGDDKANNARLILIQTGKNLGYAGGNNVGLRYALSRDDFQYVWLLNNDTIIKADALTTLVRSIQEDTGAGMCGSTLPFYHDPNTIWALGGASYNKWLCKTECIGLRERLSRTISKTEVERRMAYLAGASMLVSKAFLQTVGVMNERYFLYFEELDWALRAKGRYRLIFAPNSIVYHKVGSSILNGADRLDTSTADYYMFRNSVIITLSYHPLALPIVLPRVLTLYLFSRLMAFARRFVIDRQ
jgi:GT2 family glycosyltransferase